MHTDHISSFFLLRNTSLLFIILFYNVLHLFQVLRYRGTAKLNDSALEHTQIDVQTLEGQTETDVLLAGSIDGSLRYKQHFIPNIRCKVLFSEVCFIGYQMTYYFEWWHHFIC